MFCEEVLNLVGICMNEWNNLKGVKQHLCVNDCFYISVLQAMISWWRSQQERAVKGVLLGVYLLKVVKPVVNLVNFQRRQWWVSETVPDGAACKLWRSIVCFLIMVVDNMLDHRWRCSQDKLDGTFVCQTPLDLNMVRK